MKKYLVLLLVATVVASPWMIGGNYPFTRTALLAAAALVLVGLVMFLLKAREATTFDERGLDGVFTLQVLHIPKVAYVFLLGIAFVIFQASGVGQQSTPVDLSADVSADSITAVSSEIAVLPSSVNPAATRKHLVDLVLATSFFLLAANLLTDRRSITWMLVAIAAVGVCLSVFGIVQDLSFSGRIYGVYELLYGGDPFGPFVNGNNAAGYLLITLSASLFFVASQMFAWSRKQDKYNKVQHGLVTGDWSEPKKSIFRSLLECIAFLQPKHLYFLSMLALIIAGILMTLSRGGMVSLVVLLFVVFALIARTNWKFSLALVILILVGGVSLVLYVDRSTDVAGEIETLANVASAGELRMLHWNDALNFASENILWGVGSGTYRYVSPSFQTFHYPRVFAHAESVYVETLVEMGIFGIALLLLAFVMLFYYCLVLLKRDSAFDRSLGIVGLGCLMSQAAIAFLDFGLYQVPNSITMATVMGMVAARSCLIVSPNQATSTQVPTPRASSAWGKGLLTLAMLVITCWAVYESYGVESLRLASRRIELFSSSHKVASGRDPNSRDLISAESLLTSAQAIRPDDAEVYLRLGELEITQARTLEAEATEKEIEREILQIEKEIAALEKEDAEPELIAQNKLILEQLNAVTKEIIWSTTAPAALHQRFRRSQRKSSSDVAEVFKNEKVLTLLEEASGNFSKADTLCPLLTLPPLRLAQLACFASHGTEAEKDQGLALERQHIDRALQRSFIDTQLLYNCGFLALNSGDQAQAVQFWSKCLRYPHATKHERSIVNLCIEELPMKLFFEQVLPQNPHDLIRIAAKYFRRPDLTVPKSYLLTHTKTLIKSDDGIPKLDSELLLAEAAVLVSDYPTAIKHFQSALKLEPKNTPWRLNYARALFEVKDYDEAMRQLKSCQLDNTIRQNQVKALITKIRRLR